MASSSPLSKEVPAGHCFKNSYRSAYGSLLQELQKERLWVISSRAPIGAPVGHFFNAYWYQVLPDIFYWFGLTIYSMYNSRLGGGLRRWVTSQHFGKIDDI